MRIKIIFSLLITLFGLLQLRAQEVTPDTSDTKPVIVDLADFAEYISKDGVVMQKLMKDIRQVELRQGNTFMYCDTAIIIEKDVNAYGNVIIQQGDSINIFADSLVYNSDTEIADLYGNVVLQKEDQELFTEQLNYNLKTKVATYRTGALLTNGGAQLSSKVGYFYVDQDLAFFSDEVVVVDTSFTMQSDTLEFNTASEIATFHGPTLIQQDSAKIYCEAGFYDIPNKLAEFTENAQYVKGDQIAIAEIIYYDGGIDEVMLKGEASFTEENKKATADIIRYDQKNDIILLEGDAYYQDDKQQITSERIEYDSKNEAFKTEGRAFIEDGSQILEADTVDYDSETGLGIAYGNVIWVDTVENSKIYASTLKYNKETDFILASGDRPMLVSISGGDTLHIAADTLKSFKHQPEDSTRNFIGYRDVRIFKSDLQGLSDSIFFDGQDSVFQLKGNPILWSDSSQFVADTINMFLDSGRIDRITFINNALILSTEDELFFNQVKGREMIAYFENENLHRMSVNGNAESIYYAMDDSLAYIGVNKSVASKMMLYFADSDLNSIHFYKNPTHNVLPMIGTDHDKLRLPGFKWEWSRRPKSVDELRLPKSELLSVPQNLSSLSTEPTEETSSKETLDDNED